METIKNACTALVLAGSIALLLAASCGSEEPAEPAALFLQPADGFDAVVWSADDPGAGVPHVVDHLVHGAVKDRLPAVGALGVLSEVLGGTHANIVQGLFSRFRQMHWQHQSPIMSVHGFAMLGG